MLIGITGKIGSGKTTAEQTLVGRGFIKYSFAKPLKEIALTLGFSHDQVYGTQQQKLEVNKVWGISARQFLQKFGTDICRDFLPTVLPTMKKLWLTCFKIFYNANKENNIVISDVRFLDEAEIIRACGGIVVKLIRPSNDEGDLAAADGKSEYKKHASEIEMEKIEPDVTVVNDTTLASFCQEIENTLLPAYVRERQSPSVSAPASVSASGCDTINVSV
jgi:hypothetical protein